MGKKLKRYIPCVLLILGLALAAFLSLQNAKGTRALGRSFAIWLTDKLNQLGDTGSKKDFLTVFLVVRTWAHFFVFFVLGILSAWALNACGATRASYILGTITVLTVVAIMVEVGKIWIPGRHLQWEEALLNVAGILCGFGLWQVGVVIMRVLR